VRRERYGVADRRRRRQFVRQGEAGEAFCNRCGELIEPGSPWNLDHDDVDPRIELRAHPTCNRAVANALKTSRECERDLSSRHSVPGRGLMD